MKKWILITLFILAGAGRIFSDTYYVNGETGSEENDGLSAKKPFPAISMAIDAAKGNDEIIIEGGAKKGGKIVYMESLYLPQGKFGLKIRGVNNPEIDGDFDMEDSLYLLRGKNAVYIEANLVEISGLTIRNFLDGSPEEGLVSGAGIVAARQASKLSIFGNYIENTNWGIYLDGPTFCNVYGNTLKEIEMNGDDEAGIGININPSGYGIEENSIGGLEGNTIIEAEKFGICAGKADTYINADNSAIENNYLKECGQAGLALFSIEGIVSVKNNVFEENEAALYIGGLPIDTFIGNNVFKGSNSESEIIAGEEYDGFLLYDIWKRNNNVFEIKTFAAVNPAPDIQEVIITGNGGFIRNDFDEAEDDAGDSGKVEQN